MSEKLPDYERHPLDETVIGVQFEPLPKFSVQHIFQYWSRIRDKYPRIEEQSILLHAIEKPTLEPIKNPAQVVLAGPTAPVPVSRFMFLDPTGNELVQVQTDRFMRNWRLLNGTEIYPRFNNLFAAFWREWEDFQVFLSEEKIDGPKVDQCEITYVNFIEISQIEGGLSGMENVFSAILKPKQGGFLPPPSAMKWESSYPLPVGQGRLHVAAMPNFRNRDFKLVVNFTLSARGSPEDASRDKLKIWFELAHEWIVRGFDDLTTAKMHKLWGKRA
jgi:uncharacterized protein (TIGR04255 family)